MFTEHSNKITTIEYQELNCDSESILIDVRCPREYKKGHYTDALNIPIFSDEEYHELGQIYRKQGEAVASELGYKYALNSKPRILDSIRKLNMNNFLNSNKIYGNSLTLPIYNSMTDKEMKFVLNISQNV